MKKTVSSSGNVHHMYFKYDENGWLISQYSDSHNVKITYEYDDSGRLIHETTTNSVTVDGCYDKTHDIETHYTYSDDGCIVKNIKMNYRTIIEQYDVGNRLSHTLDMYSDNCGSESTYSYDDDTKIMTTVIKYIVHGMVTMEDRYDTSLVDGSIISYTKNPY